MTQIFQRPGSFIDVAVLIVLFVVMIYLIIRFVGGRKPLLGIGLAGGVGLLGYFLIHRRLQNAFDVEKKIAAFNDSMAQFKEKQKTRYQAVTANQEVIKTLQQRQEKLKKKGKGYETEIALLDKEINDRKELNAGLLDRTEDFLKKSRAGSAGRRELLDSLTNRFNPIPTEKEVVQDGDSGSITIDGYQLQEG